MIRGLYIGASGMTAQQHRLDALSNNLANVDVNGYKRDVSAFKAFPELLIRRMNDDGVYKFPLGSSDMAPIVGKVGTGVEYNESYTVFEQGSFKETGNPYDVALEDKGFLCGPDSQRHPLHPQRCFYPGGRRPPGDQRWLPGTR
jgi:flagellar basal-body rod protein FlgF